MNKSTQSAKSSGLLVLGLAFIPIGIATDTVAFIGVSVVFIILGLKERQEAQR